MQKETVASDQAISIVIFFVLGSTLIIGTGGQAKNDMWIAIILAILMVIPIILVYSRLLSLYQGKNIYEISQEVYGKLFGNLIVALYTWYALHLGALVIRNIGEFINTVAMPETPMIVPMMFIGLLSVWGAKSGVEVLGRSAKLFVFFIFSIIIIVQFLILPQVNLSNIKPILYNGLQPVLEGAFSSLTFPFAETVVFMAVFTSLKKKASIYKIYIVGILFSGLTILIISLRNITTLGTDFLEHFYFPSYVAVARIDVGNFVQRMEVTVALVFVSAAFIKIAVCMIAACRGIEKLFNLNDYRTVTLQVGVLMVFLAYIIYGSAMEMQKWAFSVYPIYAFPFQVIIPVITLLTAEFKRRKGISPENRQES